MLLHRSFYVNVEVYIFYKTSDRYTIQLFYQKHARKIQLPVLAVIRKYLD